jgi:hypothetical protein
MKVMIEIDLPDGQAIPRADDIKRLTDPDWICDWWHIDDVQSLQEDLTDDECREVLKTIEHGFDATVGINWDVISYYIDQVIEEREDA